MDPSIVDYIMAIYYGLQTPSGITVPVGTKKPKLSAQDRRDFWKVVRLKKIVNVTKDGTYPFNFTRR